MWQYWWMIIILACAAFGAGAAIWLYTAIALTRVVSPSAKWVGREAQYNAWGSRLMVAGTVFAAIGVVLALGQWM